MYLYTERKRERERARESERERVCVCIYLSIYLSIYIHERSWSLWHSTSLSQALWASRCCCTHTHTHTHTCIPRGLWASWVRYTDDQGCQDQIDQALYLSRAHGSRHNGRPLLPIHVSASRRLQRFRVLGFSVKVQYIVSKSASSTAPVYCVSCACVCTRANTVCACPL